MSWVAQPLQTLLAGVGALAIVAGAEPADVVGDGGLGVIAGLEAGVFAQARDVEVDVTAEAVRVPAVAQVWARAGDDVRDGGRELGIGGQPPAGHVVGA